MIYVCGNLKNQVTEDISQTVEGNRTASIEVSLIQKNAIRGTKSRNSPRLCVLNNATTGIDATPCDRAAKSTILIKTMSINEVVIGSGVYDGDTSRDDILMIVIDITATDGKKSSFRSRYSNWIIRTILAIGYGEGATDGIISAFGNDGGTDLAYGSTSTAATGTV